VAPLITQVKYLSHKKMINIPIEFVVATINRQTLLSKERLETAFKIFDQVSSV